MHQRVEHVRHSCVRGQGDAGQNGNDGHYDHHLDQGETCALGSRVGCCESMAHGGDSGWDEFRHVMQLSA